MEIYKVQSLDNVTNELVLSLMNRYQLKEVPRLKKLQGYYTGKSEIKKRKMTDPNKPNNKVSNPYGAYIVDTVQGYFLGKPVSYSSDNDALMEKLQEVYDQNHEQTHNSKLGKQLSITGIAYELLYMNENNAIKFAPLNPQEVFIIYDNSIEQHPLAAVRFYDVHDYVSDETVTYVEVYTDNHIYYYKVDEGSLVLMDDLKHYFNSVPIICYINNDDHIGDFEKVLDLIDAYDKAVSDTANNLEYFADAYMVMKGLNVDAESINQMKENRVIVVDENGSIEWLTKSSSNMEIEEYKDRLNDDIAKFSAVPNMSDEAFGNATSGESLKYKLFALENSVAIKERYYTKGLEQRIKLITTILNIKGASYSHTEVVMQFTRNLPANTNEMADLVTKLSGVLPNETLIGLLPFVEDAAYEMQKLEAEKEDTIYENFTDDVDNDIA
jgi:SPP1 family phage portal protein